MLSKSNAESLNKFGLIGVAEPDQKSAKSRKVQIFKYYYLVLDLTLVADKTILPNDDLI